MNLIKKLDIIVQKFVENKNKKTNFKAFEYICKHNSSNSS